MQDARCLKVKPQERAFKQFKSPVLNVLYYTNAHLGIHHIRLFFVSKPDIFLPFVVFVSATSCGVAKAVQQLNDILGASRGVLLQGLS